MENVFEYIKIMLIIPSYYSMKLKKKKGKHLIDYLDAISEALGD